MNDEDYELALDDVYWPSRRLGTSIPVAEMHPSHALNAHHQLMRWARGPFTRRLAPYRRIAMVTLFKTRYQLKESTVVDQADAVADWVNQMPLAKALIDRSGSAQEQSPEQVQPSLDWMGQPAPARVIREDEFVRMLLDWAGEHDQFAGLKASAVYEGARHLWQLFEEHGWKVVKDGV